MAGRSLENLDRRYGGIDSRSTSKPAAPQRHPGPGPKHGPSPKGKPQDTKRTLLRILSYVSVYRTRIIGALLCMLALSLPGMADGRFVYDSGNA